MKDVEVSFKSFKLKKVVSLVACATLALGIMVMPVDASTKGVQVASANNKTNSSYTGDAIQNGVKMPESLRMLLSKTVKVSNGYYVGIDYMVRSYLENAGYSKAYTAEEWEKTEVLVNKALDEIKNKDISYTRFDGRFVEDHQAYIKLMNDILAIGNASISYDGKNTVTMKTADGEDSHTYEIDGIKTVWVASGDAKDPTKVVDFIKNTAGNHVIVNLDKELQTMPKGVFQAAKDAGKTLSFSNKTKDGQSVVFSFEEGFTNDVDMDFGIQVSMDSELTKNLKEENALVFSFSHNGVLPGPMKVKIYNETYAKQLDKPIVLYWLNEETGKLEKQDIKLTNQYGFISFVITHCSSYVTTLSEVPANKLQVAEPKPTEKEPTANETTKNPATNETPKSTGSDGTTKETAKDDAVKKTSEQATGFKTIALLTIAGGAVFFATRKEEKA